MFIILFLFVDQIQIWKSSPQTFEMSIYIKKDDLNAETLRVKSNRCTGRPNFPLEYSIVFKIPLMIAKGS
jgi:hypothetical protein